MSAYIRGVSYHLPEGRLTNEELAAAFPEWTAEKIERKTGVRERCVAAEGETALDLAEAACRALFSESGLAPGEVDFVILMTESPDYILPPSSCLLQDRLGIPEAAGAFDINLGCSAYVYGLAVAKGLAETGVARNVLLVTAETYTKHINPKDKSTRTLFGDAAAATWVSSEVADGSLEIGEFDLGTRGSGADRLIIPDGMARSPWTQGSSVAEEDENGYTRAPQDLYMDGTGVFSFTLDVVPKTVERLLAKCGADKEGVSLFVPHQANSFMLSSLRKRLGVPAEKFFEDLSDIGNTVSASVPIALRRARDRGLVPESGSVMLIGFGVGLSWGSAMLYANGRKND